MSGAASNAVEEDAVYVVDDLLADPLAFRQLAVEAAYPQNQTPTTYAGRFSAHDYAIPNLDEYIGQLTGRAVAPAPSPGGHGRFRLCLAGEAGTGGVHIDNCHWTGVYYLTLDEHVRGGTSFFRHRPSNTLRAPVYPDDWAAWGVKSATELWKSVLLPHTNDPTKWERTRHVAMKFNRLVLFRPWLWHMAEDGFGDSAANGRLIYLMVYNEI